MSFANSSTPSLWDQRPAQDVVHKFTTMAVASPHGVEGLATGALSPPPPSRSDLATERITELSRNFFKEIVKKAMTYMEHDRRMEYRSKHLVFALEKFAEEVKQQQMLPEDLKDNAAAEGGNESGGEEEEMEWKEDSEQEKEEGEEGTEEGDGDDDEAIQEIYDREQEELDAVRDLPTAVEREEAENNIFGYNVVLPNVATLQFDELFPPVASNTSTMHCLSMEILAKTWNDTGNRFYRSDLNVHGEDEDAFYGKLNDSLNAYVATMLLEPRSLDAAFANVDG